jgi:DNA-binding HxlR family transcriptional regulator
VSSETRGPAGGRVRHAPPADARELLDLLDDPFTQRVVCALRDGPKAATEVVESCDASRATVYRRLRRLADHDLVAVETECHPDGHHRNRYRLTLDSLTVEIGEDGLYAAVALTDDPAGDARPDPR